MSSAPALYIVATPIGNLEDITLRALRILKEVDLIACEDTRQTQKLLNRYQIATPTVSYHEHNERERAAELLPQLRQGKSIALVSDAGMPAIADPGYRLVSLAIEHAIPVVPIPGPTAFVAALAASGLATDSFCFRGFLPAKAGARRQLLEELRASRQTEIFYEAPHRILESMKDVVDVLGADRPLTLAREITKLHEEFSRGSAVELLRALEKKAMRGEFTLLIGKAQAAAQPAPFAQSRRARLQEIMRDHGLDEKAALKLLAKELGISKSELYRDLQRSKPR